MTSGPPADVSAGRKRDVEALCGLLGYSFSDPSLLRQALTHRSHSSPHNERLEFLGDSVLNLAVARLLYTRFPQAPEGTLSRLRANLVNQQTLEALAAHLRLGELLRLGEGELKSGGAQRPSILANALEAIFGAIYLDSSFDQAQQVIQRLVEPYLARLDLKTLGKDPKTQLQEFLQGRRLQLPHYTVVATHGRAHEQRFVVECLIGELGIRCLGEGPSRRKAEQEAARQALALAEGTRTER
ncbi:MAG: ribonuclease III [Azospira oryzae]|nr:MAG: ribonuclease III [Azospira oryzae]PZP82100.1 MAG: ribonuclease III [Azospira oryzae]